MTSVFLYFDNFQVSYSELRGNFFTSKQNIVNPHTFLRGGHQDAITGIDALHRESCITSGGRDQSVIVYVIVEDKQLRFSGHQDSIDGVKLLNERTFFTYSQDG